MRQPLLAVEAKMIGNKWLWMALAVISLVFFGSLSRAALRSEIPGASSKEREIRWAWKYLHEFVISCTASTNECQDPAMKGIAQQLTQYLPEWNRTTDWTSLLEFVSERERPDLFRVKEGESEVHRLVVTGLTRYSKVYVNADRMMLPLTQWVGLLTHEAVLHLGYSDDQDRLPDLVGSIIASHFQKQTVASGLEEYRHPEARLVIFNSRAKGRVATGFFALDFYLSDLEMSPADLQAYCGPGTQFEEQTSRVPFWRVSRIQYRKGLVSVRASSTTTIVCMNPETSERVNKKLAFIAEADMKYVSALTPDEPWWTMPSEFVKASLRTGHTDSAAELITINRSFNVLSITNEAPRIKSGEEWKTRIVIQSIDPRVPRDCQVFMTGANWSYQRDMNLPALERFQKCAITDLGDSKWRLDAATAIPANAQPDYFEIPLIGVGSTDSQRYAIPKRPVYLKVENPNAPAPLKAIAWRVLDLEPLTGYAGKKLSNSYIADFNKPFWLEVDFAGTPEVKLGYLELNLLVNSGGSLVSVPQTMRADAANETLLSVETLKTPGGTRLRYQLRIPKAGLAYDLRGIQFERFYAQTSDFSWAEMETSSPTEAWVLERGSIL